MSKSVTKINIEECPFLVCVMPIEVPLENYGRNLSHLLQCISSPVRAKSVSSCCVDTYIKNETIKNTLVGSDMTKAFRLCNRN